MNNSSLKKDNFQWHFILKTENLRWFCFVCKTDNSWWLFLFKYNNWRQLGASLLNVIKRASHGVILHSWWLADHLLCCCHRKKGLLHQNVLYEWQWSLETFHQCYCCRLHFPPIESRGQRLKSLKWKVIQLNWTFFLKSYYEYDCRWVNVLLSANVSSWAAMVH